jgi:hypothetical protein
MPLADLFLPRPVLQLRGNKAGYMLIIILQLLRSWMFVAAAQVANACVPFAQLHVSCRGRLARSHHDADKLVTQVKVGTLVVSFCCIVVMLRKLALSGNHVMLRGCM